MKAIAIEPKCGYLTKEKADYRANLYKGILKLSGDAIKDKTLLFMPSKNDAEIKMALSVGFREENLYACDDSAALLATAAWRKEYPKIKILGSRLSRAIERLKSGGVKIDVANLDLCSNLCSEVFTDLHNIARYFINPDIIIGLTLLKGRESASEACLAKMLHKNINGTIDRPQIAFHYILESFRGKGKIVLSEEYKSNNQVMCYALYHFISLEHIEKAIYHVFNGLHSEVKDALEIDRQLRSYPWVRDYVERRAEMDGKTLTRIDYDREWDREVKRRVSMRSGFWEKCNSIKERVSMQIHDVSWPEYKGNQRPWIDGSNDRDAVRDFLQMESTPFRRIT